MTDEATPPAVAAAAVVGSETVCRICRSGYDTLGHRQHCVPEKPSPRALNAVMTFRDGPEDADISFGGPLHTRLARVVDAAFAEGAAPDVVVSDVNPLCSFCGKSRKQVRKMISAGPPEVPVKVFICDECLICCVEVFIAEANRP